MQEFLAQGESFWTLVCAVALVIMVLLAIFVARRRLLRSSGSELLFARLGLIDVRSGLDAPNIEAAIREAEEKGGRDNLPSLYLHLAQRTLEAGETAKAYDLLQRSIRVAAAAEQTDVHALARVALGDLAHADGDLTTACEHWQIARNLFIELKLLKEHDAVEGRMLRNQCPTDWVLNDF